MAYNLLDLRTRIRAKINDTAYPSSKIDGFIDDSQNEIAGLFPFPQLRTKTKVTCAPGDVSIALPDNHMLTSKLQYVDQQGAVRDISDYVTAPEYFDSEYSDATNNQPGAPDVWSEYGGMIHLTRPTNYAYEFYVVYQRIPTELTTETSVPDFPRNFREAIELGAVYRIEEERGNDDIAAVRQNRFNDRTSDLIMQYVNTTSVAPDFVIRPRSA